MAALVTNAPLSALPSTEEGPGTGTSIEVAERRGHGHYDGMTASDSGPAEHPAAGRLGVMTTGGFYDRHSATQGAAADEGVELLVAIYPSVIGQSF